MKLEEFLSKTGTDTITIKNIVTASNHKKIIISTLNKVAYEHPEWKTTIYSLAEYTKQKWALEQKVIGSDMEIFKHSENKFEMAEKYKFTASVIDLIDEAVVDEYFKLNTFSSQINFQAFEAAHDLQADDVSKYIMTSHYEDAVVEFCQKHNDEIASILKESKLKYESLEKDEALVYHDTDMLIKTVRWVIKKKKVLRDIDDQALIELFDKCLKQIGKFPFDGITLEKIMRKYMFENMSDKKIGLDICSSETFVISKRTQATELISLLLWGYSSRMMLKK